MSHPVSFERRAGEPFDDVRVEDYVRGRAQGCSIKVSCEHAGIGYVVGSKLEKSPEVLERKKELTVRNTTCTVSKAWIVEELKKNAIDARNAEQFKASNESLKMLYEIITKDAALTEGLGESLPRQSGDLRAELRKRLSAMSSAQQPITVPGVEVEREETLQ